MKIKTSKLNRSNLEVQLIKGVSVYFDSNLQGDLKEEDRFEEIVKRDSSISSAEPEAEKADENKGLEAEKADEEFENTAENTVDSEEQKATEESLVEQTEEKVSEEKAEDTGLDLQSLKVDELRDLCKEAELDKNEWKDLKKDQLIKYIEERLN